MDWRVKAAVQGLLARVPGGVAVNDVLQRAVGDRRDERSHIDSTVTNDWLFHQEVLRDLGFEVRGSELLEIGTGWLPVFPLCYALAGARHCYTYDLHPHLNPAKAVVALRHLENHLQAIAHATHDTEQAVRERWQRLSTIDDGTELLKAAGIVYCAPADSTATGIADASLSLVFSNSVLEHVSADILGDLMQESRRVLEPQGLSLHSVNCGDHYAYFDRSITQAHYLRFPDRKWRMFNNDILYQNRLRAVDFVTAAKSAGMRVMRDIHVPRPELLKRFDELPIAPEFRRYSAEQLCTTSVTFAAQPLENSQAS